MGQTAFNRVAVLAEGYGLFPRSILADWNTIASPAAGESAEQDTGLSIGSGVVSIMCTTGAHFLRVGFYTTSGDSAAGGQLPAANLWPLCRTNSAAAPRVFMLNVDPTRRYFRTYTDTAQTLYWTFERV